MFDLYQCCGTVLVVDKIHAEHILDGKFVSCFTSDCAAQGSLTVPISPNKALELGGLKASYSVIPDDSLRQRPHQQLEKSSVTSPNLFGVREIILAYQYGLP